jgi:hypothetical protein
MVNINRIPATPEIEQFLEKQKKIKSGKYENEEIGKLLKKMFFEKCYLCEENVTSYEVDHFKPHLGGKFSDLKFDWNNLYFSCPHCNNAKSDDYNTSPSNEILDCCNPSHDIENSLRYEMVKLKSEIKISATRNEPIVENTAKLLNLIYEGSTSHKKIEAETLRKKIFEEVLKFQKKIDKYLNNKSIDELNKVVKKMSRKSPFCAFKRSIIKNDHHLSNEFAGYFD